MTKEKLYVYVCHRCKKQVEKDRMGLVCPYCDTWQHEHLAKTEVVLKDA